MVAPRLIPHWRRAWRFMSVQAAALLALLSMLQADVLPYLQPVIDPRHWPYVTAGLSLAIVLLRLIAQPGVDEPGTQP